MVLVKSSSATLCDNVRGFRRVGSLKTHGNEGDMQICLVLGSGIYELSRNELLPPYERKKEWKSWLERRRPTEAAAHS